jgi:hypothetical protein
MVSEADDAITHSIPHPDLSTLTNARQAEVAGTLA